MRGWIARAGLFFSVFAVVALSGPGRIDIVDGQTRYEVARSLVQHRDSVIRDPNVWFVVFPGRDGRNYTKYRFPQSAAGVAAIWAADGFGPVNEARRHFFFTLTSAVASACLAVIYASLFRCLGHPPRGSLIWAAAGVFCTPSWFYGTSTFDDILGSAAVVLAVSAALTSRHSHRGARSVLAGLALGLAFNCKEPLGIFVLPVLAAIGEPGRDWRGRWREQAVVVLLLAAAVAVYLAYDRYKFPPGSTAGHAELLKRYVPWWSAHPDIALLALLFSLGTGVLFYNPAIMICCSGLCGWWRREKWFCQSLLAAITVFVGFICFLTFFKGDPAWGPRYLTPIFAVLWIFAPAGAQRERPWVVAAALGLGLVVQMGALCIDYHRLYIERGLPSAFYVSAPDLYFHPGISHLMNRPREIVEVLSNQDGPATCYSPSPSPTFAFPVLDFVEKEPQALRKYHILNSFRFWWMSFLYLDRQSRPVDVARTVAVLIGMALAGLVVQIGCTHKSWLGRARRKNCILW